MAAEMAKKLSNPSDDFRANGISVSAILEAGYRCGSG